MQPDQTVEMMRRLLLEALLLSAPMLIAACVVSLLVSLAQTLTGVQEQTLTVVPRLVVVSGVVMVTLPWVIHRLVSFTLHLLTDLHRYLG
ncbi:flagellar biosynthetic protein FliQ [Granulicella arctica]|uniref:Flagellar biosynthetic protein FliQ n=1 Tax=Granulicella arctica TaxID=940613 RepID=A0A7Y9TGV3_9BACT|nr:flagellar biosynthetic protein FliQ [Granulicella arctica]NYF80351.1 flagellar biosynthetic protein FliQ [Granulicella arctica]